MKMIQVRNVPDDVHRKIKMKAAMSGMSLSDYLLREIVFLADQPTTEEWMARLSSLPSVSSPETSAEIIRAHRGPI
jgi:plasmid stability protein